MLVADLNCKAKPGWQYSWSRKIRPLPWIHYRYLETHGEALPVTEDITTRAALAFLMLHTRGQLPLAEAVESGQVWKCYVVLFHYYWFFP